MALLLGVPTHEQWPASYAWMLDWAEKFKAAFAQRIKEIVLPERVSGEVEAPSFDLKATATQPAVSGG